jgi:hypothetical protein
MVMLRDGYMEQPRRYKNIAVSIDDFFRREESRKINYLLSDTRSQSQRDLDAAIEKLFRTR